MNLCEDGHQEICFEGRGCPLCEKIKELTQDIDDLNQKLDVAKDEIETLNKE